MSNPLASYAGLIHTCIDSTLQCGLGEQWTIKLLQE
nr:MAG TPA: hypothetical protein [Caudoviricetes sp.]